MQDDHRRCRKNIICHCIFRVGIVIVHRLLLLVQFFVRLANITERRRVERKIGRKLRGIEDYFLS